MCASKNTVRNSWNNLTRSCSTRGLSSHWKKQNIRWRIAFGITLNTICRRRRSADSGDMVHSVGARQEGLQTPELPLGTCSNLQKAGMHLLFTLSSPSSIDLQSLRAICCPLQPLVQCLQWSFSQKATLGGSLCSAVGSALLFESQRTLPIGWSAFLASRDECTSAATGSKKDISQGTTLGGRTSSGQQVVDSAVLIKSARPAIIFIIVYIQHVIDANLPWNAPVIKQIKVQDMQHLGLRRVLHTQRLWQVINSLIRQCSDKVLLIVQVILLRSLFTYVRILPAYKLYKACKVRSTVCFCQTPFHLLTWWTQINEKSPVVAHPSLQNFVVRKRDLYMQLTSPK